MKVMAAGETGSGTLSVHNFSEKLSEQTVHFHVLRMKDSFFLWVGTAPTFSNLAVAMCTKFLSKDVAAIKAEDLLMMHFSQCRTNPEYRMENKRNIDPMPVSTLVLGDASDTTPNSVAQRLAKKTGKQVFISYNLPNTSTNTSLSLQVETRIKQEMDAHPDKF